MKKLLIAVLFTAAYTLSAYAQPENQVLVYFQTGVNRVAPSNNTANITSAGVLNLLVEYGIPTSNVVPSFPSFNETDTVNVEMGESSRQMNRGKVYTITVSNPSTKNSFIAALNGLPEVLYAESNGVASNNLIPVDGRFAQQWGMRNTIVPGADIHAEAAWDIFTGNSNAIIAIIDNGVDVNHNDLNAKILGGDNNFSILTDGWGRQFSHGSHVAGIAAAVTNNGGNNGVAGVDWQARIHSRNIFDGNGDPDITQSIIDAVNFNNNVWTLNHSYGLLNNGAPGRYSVTVRSAFAHAYRNNRVSCIAMGNHQVVSPNVVAFPAGFNSGVIAVGASDINDGIAAFSANGPHIDVAAPGVGIWSTNFNNGYIDLDGTSMATPHVAGLASLLKGFNTNLANDDIEQIIRLSADDRGAPGFDNAFGAGRINAQRALQFLQAPNTVQHLSVTGGTVDNTSGNMVRTFLGVPGLPDANYIVRRIEVRTNISFPSMCNVIGVWGRGVGTTGYREENARCFGEGICEVVPGTLTNTGATLRTWIYEVYNALGQYLGHYPRSASQVVFQCTILGVPSTVGNIDVTGLYNICDNVPNEFLLAPEPPAGTPVNWSIYPDDAGMVVTPSGNSITLDASNALKDHYYNITATISPNGCLPRNVMKQVYLAPSPWWGNITGSSGSNTIYGNALTQGDNLLYMGSGADFFDVQIYSNGSQGYFPGAWWEYVSGDYAISSGQWWIHFDFHNGPGDAYYNFRYSDECGVHSVSFHFSGTYTSPPSFAMQQAVDDSYELKLSPNPSSSYVSITVKEKAGKARTSGKSFDHSTLKTVTIYDKLGNVVIRKKMLIPQSGARLDVSRLKSGDVYNLTIEYDQVRISKKLIKQ